MNSLARADSQQSAPVLTAPDHWRVIDFISDLHLNAGEPATMQAWRQYMQSTRADAVFILGDLFDVWVGDDMLEAPGTLQRASSFEQQCVSVIRATSKRLALFLMHGNRDFLLGKAFATASGVALIADPTLLVFAQQRYLLSHGDALCLDDVDYMQFRGMVRSDSWQRSFLALPLTERQAMGMRIRAESEARKRLNHPYVDLHAAAVDELMLTNQSSTLIHGHTHRPAQHELAGGRRRVVLSDWDARGTPPRTEILRLSLDPTLTDAPVSLQRIEAALADGT
ncbi:MAG: hypothetical protein RLZ81_332 [Pseudomonadota bacterium]|jgi:UDP-2,3-diacylglucosamine hydrolase